MSVSGVAISGGVVLRQSVVLYKHCRLTMIGIHRGTSVGGELGEALSSVDVLGWWFLMQKEVIVQIAVGQGAATIGTGSSHRPALTI
jgi:hypothetical protein